MPSTMVVRITRTKDAMVVICIGMIRAETSKTWLNTAKAVATIIRARTITTTTTIIIIIMDAHITHMKDVWAIICIGMIPVEINRI